MENTKKRDRRIEKTRSSIRDAFIKLITEKDISQITIKELAETADINRKTFYMHYSSVEDILDNIENDLIKRLLAIMDDYDFSDSKFDIYGLFSSLNGLLNENLDLYKQLVKANSYNLLIVKVKTILKKGLIEKYSEKYDMDEAVMSLYAEYIASGVMSIYIEWLKTDSQISLEELAKMAGSITLNGIQSLI